MSSWDPRELACGRSAFAGLVIGSTCGFLFGTVEAAKNAGLTSDMGTLGSKLRDPTVMRYFFRQQLQTTALFTGSFLTYQVVRCALDLQGVDKNTGFAVAGVTSIAPFLPSRLFRRNLPYACILVGLDVYSGGIDRDIGRR